MSTSAIDVLSTSANKLMKRIRRSRFKTAIVYFIVSIFCVAITNVYALFGHGVRSGSMDFMFLYPLFGGTVVFLLAARLTKGSEQTPRTGYARAEYPRTSYFLAGNSHTGYPRAGYARLGYNLYNSGIACLTSAAMLTGIMEIAGTGSAWIQYIRIIGLALLAAAIICQTTAAIRGCCRRRHSL